MSGQSWAILADLRRIRPALAGSWWPRGPFWWLTASELAAVAAWPGSEATAARCFAIGSHTAATAGGWGLWGWLAGLWPCARYGANVAATAGVSGRAWPLVAVLGPGLAGAPRPVLDKSV